MKHRVAPLVLALSTLAACGGGGDGAESPFNPFVNQLTGDPNTEMRGDVSIMGVSIGSVKSAQFPVPWTLTIDFVGTYAGAPDSAQKFPLPFEMTLDGALVVADNTLCSYTGTPKHYTCTANGGLTNQTEGDHKVSVRALPKNIAGHVWQPPTELVYTNKFVP
jgi:hypothetical protein